MHGASFLLAALILIAPSVAAKPLLGTQTMPELEDQKGDVAYSPAYVGEQNHDYIDVDRGWLAYDETSDTFTFALLTGDATLLTSPTQLWVINCQVTFEAMIDAGNVGDIMFSWNKLADDPEVYGGVTRYEPESDAVASSGGRGTAIESSFNFTLADPGWFQWTVNRTDLTRWGDVLVNPTAVCSEQLSPREGTTFAVNNRDTASSETRFEMASLGSRPAENGENNEHPSEPMSPSAPRDSTTAVTWFATVCALIVSTFLARRR